MAGVCAWSPGVGVWRPGVDVWRPDVGDWRPGVLQGPVFRPLLFLILININVNVLLCIHTHKNTHIYKKLIHTNHIYRQTHKQTQPHIDRQTD